MKKCGTISVEIFAVPARSAGYCAPLRRAPCLPGAFRICRYQAFRALCSTLLLVVVGCSGRRSEGTAPVFVDAGVSAVCEGYRAPPRLGVVDAVVDEESAARALSFRAARVQERIRAEVDPEAVRATLRIEEEHLAAHCLDLDGIVDVGRGLFERTFTRAEGQGNALGGTPSPLRRVQQGRFGGPDALSCVSCHWKGGAAGGGDRADNAYLFGDGDDVDRADVRNPPALWGAGWVELAAAELSADLGVQKADLVRRARSLGQAQSGLLVSKGISFGTLTAQPDGAVAGAVGVDADLIVKPFGLKGTRRTLREFVGASLHLHLGMQAEEVVRAQNPTVDLGDGGGDDPDGDGVTREITSAQLTALVLYLATLDAPPLRALEEAPDREAVLFSNELSFVRSPEFTLRFAQGFALFGRVGCAVCHVPFVRVDRSRYQTQSELGGAAVVVDLAADGARPTPARDGAGRFLLPVFSDFRRHDLGEALAGLYPEDGVPAGTWLTRRLWGSALTTPWLRTGSAMTVDEAIVMHGGEAAVAARKFALLSEAEQIDLRLFLASLARAPSVRIR